MNAAKMARSKKRFTWAASTVVYVLGGCSAGFMIGGGVARLFSDGVGVDRLTDVLGGMGIGIMVGAVLTLGSARRLTPLRRARTGSTLFLLSAVAFSVLQSQARKRATEVVTPKPVAAAGDLPGQWAAGVDCAAEPPFQVHAYDEDTYIIRQSKCVNYEAPFMFLFVGSERALLMDTGADPDADLYGTVMALLQVREAGTGIPAVPLVVAHTHSHGDHRSADAQFVDAPGVETMVGLAAADVTTFWGFTDWPNDVTTYDLGDRVVDAIAIPGHHETSIALYDRQTRLLLTGDSVYPGHLFIPSLEAWPVVTASVDRLVAFAKSHPVDWVLGNHIEVSSQPVTPYVYGSEVHPDERALHLPSSTLDEIASAMRAMGDEPRCEVHDDFVIQPTFVCGFDWNG